MFSRQGSELSPSQFLTVATLTPVLRANSFCESLCCVRSWAIFLPIMESPPSQFRIRQRARKRVVIIGLKLLPLPIPGRNGCLLMSKRNSSPSARGQARRSTAADSRPSERWMEEGEERRAVVDREKLRAMRRAKNLTQESLSERGNISVRYLRSLETRDCNPSRVQDVRHQPGAGHNHRGSSASSGGGRSIITQTHISKRAEGREQRPSALLPSRGAIFIVKEH